jgi:hypothetical protein
VGRLQSKKNQYYVQVFSFMELRQVNLPRPINEKATASRDFSLIGGERGIRTPGPVTVNGFQDRRVKPLCHLSAAKIHAELVLQKKLCRFVISK